MCTYKPQWHRIEGQTIRQTLNELKTLSETMQSPSYTYCTINPNQHCRRTTSRAGDTRSGSRKTGASKLLCSMDSGDSFFWTSCTSLSSAAAAAASMRTMQYQIHLRKTLIGNRRRFIRLYRWVCQKYQFASRISRWFTVLQRPPTVCRVYYTVPDWLCTLMRTAIPKKNCFIYENNY